MKRVGGETVTASDRATAAEAEPPRVSGDLIRLVRLFHGRDQEEFAKCFQVSRRTVIRWEQRGNCFITDEKAFRPQLWGWMHGRYLAAQKDGVT
jgi:DNA-binding XRE family transcriptional regulator